MGIATLEALLIKCGGDANNVTAGVRDEEKFKRNMINVSTVQTDMNDVDEMTDTFRGYERVFIVVPNVKDRTKLALNVLEAAKAANVKFILLLSVTLAPFDTIFGRQFKPLEEKVRSLDIPFTILRLPMFMENILLHAQTIAEDDRIYDPRDPREKFWCVALEDVGQCAAEILLNPPQHKGRTYKLVSESFSMIDLSQSLTTILGRPIKVKETTWDQFRSLGNDKMIPQWQTEGLIEWLKYDPMTWITGDDQETIRKISGVSPVTVRQFLASNVDKFGWKSYQQYRRTPYDDDPIMQYRRHQDLLMVG